MMAPVRLALIYPPDFAPPTNAFAALPLLNACAKRAGHQTLVMDVNAEAFSSMLWPENLELYFKTLDRLTATPAGQDSDLFRLLHMFPRELILEAPQAAADLRKPEIFYDPARHRHAMRVIRTAHAFLDVLTPWFDTRNKHFTETLYGYMAHDVTEPYTEAYRYSTIPKLQRFEPDLIAFSCPFSKQIATAMRLAKCIRQAVPRASSSSSAAPAISDAQHVILTDPRFYDYIDYAIVGDGEEALLELARRDRRIEGVRRRRRAVARDRPGGRAAGALPQRRHGPESGARLPRRSTSVTTAARAARRSTRRPAAATTASARSARRASGSRSGCGRPRTSTRTCVHLVTTRASGTSTSSIR